MRALVRTREFRSLAAVVVLQSFALPVASVANVGWSLLIAATIVLSRIRWTRPRSSLTAALAVSAGVLVTAASGAGLASAGLLVLLILVTSIDVQHRSLETWASIRLIGLSIAWLAAAQFAIQVAGGPFESVHTIVPGAMIDGYNSVSPFFFGSNYIRSNGFFLLEPSTAGQFIALGIIAETRLGRIRLRFIIFGVLAMVATGTGTGFLLLAGHFLIRALGALRAGGRHGAAFSAARAIVMLCVVAVTAIALGLSTGRVREIESEGSSFQFRFVRPYSFVADGLSDGTRLILGHGPGTADDLSRESLFLGSATDPTLFTVIPKMLFEYGVILGAAVALLIWLNCCRTWPGGYRFSAFLFVFVLNGGPLNPATIVPAWLIGCGVLASSKHREAAAGRTMPQQAARL